MRQTWIHVIVSILFVMGIIIKFSSLGYMIFVLWICKKSFSSTIFLITKVHPWNETNLGTQKNLYSFCYVHRNHVLLIGMDNIYALKLQEKLFFPSFSLSSKFLHQMRQTWILIVTSIRFVIGTTIIFSTLGYTILML